ncbi:MAG: LysR family transcriptional regulator [Synergistaceae bacterium]|jgi:DNA-binding transcriptional LysR family regulator|nr:LysR family transcriptional regulator [Synergistaceae bacterium]
MDNKDWELIKFLREEKSASRTADKLYLSQPAITYRLKKIENEMGVQLFIKNNRGITFTNAGERLLSYSDKMLSQYNEIVEHVQNREGIVSGTIHIGAPPFFATKYLPSLFREFNCIYPDATLILYSGLSSELMDQLQRQEILISVVRGRHHWEEEQILVFEETIKIVSSKPLELEDLAHLPFISYRTDTH